MHKSILGLDYGGVIFHPLLGVPIIGAFENLQMIVRSGIYEEIWIISKPLLIPYPCFWLDRWNFWTRTGISRDNLRYVGKWKEKAVVCRQLGITHFVDNRLGVLRHMHDIKHRFLFRPAWWEIKKKADLKEVKVVHDWRILGNLLTS